MTDTLDPKRQAHDEKRQPAASGQDASALASWMRCLHAELMARNLDADALFEEAGLEVALLNDPSARYPIAHTSRAWRLAAERTGDEAIGLKATRHIKTDNFHTLGYSILASSHMREAFGRMQKFMALVAVTGQMELIEQGDTACLRLSARDDPQPAVYSFDAFMAVMTLTSRVLSRNTCAPFEIQLKRAEPGPQARAYFETVFECPVIFSAEHNQLLFRTEQLESPLRSANPLVASHLDQASQAAISDLHRAGFVQQVQGWMMAHLTAQRAHEVNDEAAARAFHMSSRTLQRKLAEENAQFSGLWDSVRKKEAQHRLEHGKDPLTAIALDLGFSDASSFSRACKRWFGKAPSAFRSDAL